jgi:ADP-ribosylglycohydrolase
MFGLAYGDALGKPTEFMDYPAIVSRYGPDGPRQLTGEPALVTDDTQMALAVGEALLEVPDPTAARIEPVLRRRFVAWAYSPENDRAPGMTCLRACGGLADGKPWIEATQTGSKGCGANMRVTPVGLVAGLTDDQRAGVAQLQAAMTHGHPTGLAASELTAYAVHWLRGGLAPADLLAALRNRCDEQRKIYRGDWLGELWRRPLVDSPEEFIAQGWTECAAALDKVAAGLEGGHFDGDPCLVTGAGWIAEEALASALYCYLISPDQPVTVLGRAAASSGDSDSIACLAGAFAGATLGLGAWPAGWQTQIEYSDRLMRLGTAWD